MSRDFIASQGGRVFKRSPGRDRIIKGALSDGSIRYFNFFRSGKAGSGVVYTEAICTLDQIYLGQQVHWRQHWRFRPDVYGGYGPGGGDVGRHPVPDLIEETGNPGFGTYTQVSVVKSLTTMEKLSETTYRFQQGTSYTWLLEFMAPVPLAEFVAPMEDEFLAASGFPGRETEDEFLLGVFKISLRSKFFQTINPNEGVNKKVRRPATLAIIGGSFTSPFSLAGTRIDDNEVLRPQDLQFLNNQGENSSGFWPLCGVGLTRGTESILYEATKTNIGAVTYKRAIYQLPNRNDLTTAVPINCENPYTGEDSILKIRSGEVMGFIDTEAKLKTNQQFMAFASGTGNPETDQMNTAYEPVVSPACW